ncbi:ribonuclease H [Candidatus Falkowbacteria bacterium CG10_big_fil_rev_8_21_14_0_10_39_9]|uniref:Ribonuclease H n=1 Tax=Candidatus Falkowbacteria bacterium CG10_big_fil_rev_8_21_14_0_10_39_9 TaxID=1974566 RepID=A0A2M6WQD1_9BACT|nr:MAG: ribonuclease H [Candidatus Falkowbacteria bacterium CG10_big_fil_rev_8_21_14_0_10_39_9]
MSDKKLIIYTDGGARGNPGPSGIGVVVYNEQRELVREYSDFLGIATNNQAEYKAVILALKKSQELGGEELHFYLDSELVVKQLRGEYKVKNKDLASLFLEIHNLAINFQKISYTHVRRELNQEADRLANEAMDRGE